MLDFDQTYAYMRNRIDTNILNFNKFLYMKLIFLFAILLLLDSQFVTILKVKSQSNFLRDLFLFAFIEKF